MFKNACKETSNMFCNVFHIKSRGFTSIPMGFPSIFFEPLRPHVPRRHDGLLVSPPSWLATLSLATKLLNPQLPTHLPSGHPSVSSHLCDPSTIHGGFYIESYPSLFTNSGNKHFLHAYCMSSTNLDPEGNARNRKAGKRQITCPHRASISL